MFQIEELLRQTVALGASDVHLKVGQRPCLRLDGRLRSSDLPPLTPDDMSGILERIVPAHVRECFARDHEADFSLHVEGAGRYRVNAFLSQGSPVLAFRHVKDRVPTLAQLNLPPAISRVAEVESGIVIICGTTGCGKSTTMAAMLDQINTAKAFRIVTIEDPVEYCFTDRSSVISQREVGLDTPSFQSAMTHVMRQDPDVIVIGEMRDQVTFRTALAAAETGHLVITTLHSATASMAVQRILEFFPSGEWDQIRLNVAATLQAVICQRLVEGAEGGRVPAVEIMINTPTVRKLVEKNRLDMLPAAIETGTEDGMQTFNQSLYGLIGAKQITEEEGLRHASNPQALRMNLQGIFLDESRRILTSL